MKIDFLFFCVFFIRIWLLSIKVISWTIIVISSFSSHCLTREFFTPELLAPPPPPTNSLCFFGAKATAKTGNPISDFFTRGISFEWRGDVGVGGSYRGMVSVIFLICFYEYGEVTWWGLILLIFYFILLFLLGFCHGWLWKELIKTYSRLTLI